MKYIIKYIIEIFNNQSTCDLTIEKKQNSVNFPIKPVLKSTNDNEKNEKKI